MLCDKLNWWRRRCRKRRLATWQRNQLLGNMNEICIRSLVTYWRNQMICPTSNILPISYAVCKNKEEHTHSFSLTLCFYSPFEHVATAHSPLCIHRPSKAFSHASNQRYVHIRWHLLCACICVRVGPTTRFIRISVHPQNDSHCTVL